MPADATATLDYATGRLVSAKPSQPIIMPTGIRSMPICRIQMPPRWNCPRSPGVRPSSIYTPAVVNSPRRIEEDIWCLRQGLFSILMTELNQEEHLLRETASIDRRAKRYLQLYDFDGNDPLAKR